MASDHEQTMMWIARPVLVVLIAAGALIGCGQADPSASGATGGPPRATIALRTAAPEPAGTPQACMASVIEGILVRDAPSGIAIRDTQGVMRQVVWPYGYGARDDRGRLAVLDASGAAVAHEGDRVAIGGGAIESGRTWLGCGGTTILAP
jgi:hypothetical protein